MKQYNVCNLLPNHVGWRVGCRTGCVISWLGLLHYLSHIYIYFKFSIKKKKSERAAAGLAAGWGALFDPRNLRGGFPW